MKPGHPLSTTVVPADRLCPRCGAALDGFGPEGLCGACMLGSGLDEAGAEVSTGAQRRMGDYELLGEIARGGMGVVYRARQVSLNRVVAVKMVLRGEFADASSLARFRQEAEAAAHLQHPNIVAIHEVGESKGQHFFSMDYVEGRSLSALVRDGPLPAAQAARYVERIARAVHYAHEQGVLHRDLKPSNVLLDANDEPRVTDFGLAKRLNPDPAASGANPEAPPDLTLSGQVMGTPSFMPPEQAGGRREQMSPRSDVYSLGAILYHLLTGRPPFVGPDTHTIIEQVLKSDVVALRLLNPSVPRDLETIALKCLEKESFRRYASALALAEDVARYLNHEPIHAVPPSSSYRARKFVRRHRVAVSVAAGVVAVLTTATVVSIMFGYRAIQAKAKEEAERKRATLAETAANERAREALESQAESKAVLEFLTGRILAAVRPELEESGLGHDVTLRAAIEAAAVSIPKDFSNLPTVEARIRWTLGRSFDALGEYDKSIEQLERAAALLEGAKGSNHVSSLQPLGELAPVYRKAGRLDQAQATAEKLLAMSTRLLGRTDWRTIEALGILSAIQSTMGRQALALSNYLEAAQLAREHIGTNHLETLTIIAGLANVYHSMQRYEDSLRLRREVVRGREGMLGATNSYTLLAKANLAATLQDMRNYPEAIALHREILPILESKLETNHPMVLHTLHNLGVAYSAASQNEQALPILERAATLRITRLGADHPDTLLSTEQLAKALSKVDRLPEAIRWWTNTLQHLPTQPGRSRDRKYGIMEDLASAYRATGQMSEVLELRERMLTDSTAENGTQDQRTLNYLEHQAWSYLHHTNRYAEAEALFRKLEAAQREAQAKSNVLATTLGQLGLALLRQGKFKEAEPALREALPTFERIQPTRTSTFSVYSQLGWSLLGQKKYEKAATMLLKAYDGFILYDTEKPSPASIHYLNETIRLLAELYEAWGKPEEAARWREKLKPSRQE